MRGEHPVGTAQLELGAFQFVDVGGGGIDAHDGAVASKARRVAQRHPALFTRVADDQPLGRDRFAMQHPIPYWFYFVIALLTEYRQQILADELVTPFPDQRFEPLINQPIAVRLIDVRHGVGQAVHRAAQLSLAILKLHVRSLDVMDVGADHVKSLRFAVGPQIRDDTNALPARRASGTRHQPLIDHRFTIQGTFYTWCGERCRFTSEHFFSRLADDFMAWLATLRQKSVVDKFVALLGIDIANRLGNIVCE